MSRWSPDSLEVRFGTEALEFRLHARSGARQWTRQLDLPVIGDESWTPAISVLRDELTKITQEPLRLKIILDASVARYRIVPWHAEFATGEARAGFVKHCFVEAFGDLAAAWVCRGSEGAYGRASLAAAIERPLVDALTAMGASGSIRSLSIEPMLSQQFELARRQIRVSSFWFAVSDSARHCLLLFRDGTPALVVVADQSEASLDTLLEREWCTRGFEEKRPNVFFLAQPSAHRDGEVTGRWQYVLLRNAQPVTGARAATRGITEPA